MDRNQAKEFYPILQAFAEGKTIETRRKPTTDNNGVTKDGWFEFNDWTEMKELEYWVNVEYRIKPEPKFRPFKDAEECWNEMKKHQPFGWVIKHNEGKILIGEVPSDGVVLHNQRGSMYDFDEANRILTFADGTPFGVKEEE